MSLTLTLKTLAVLALVALATLAIVQSEHMAAMPTMQHAPF
ncbi:hypothetical protein [Pseudoduganella namucuonensis]|uniref:Uncharacterized protein n=1 Tax=Pseudoduganella namucuonensis TaxID=1035707 RepID=A0A1I7HB40_9BURK|nr:hypothetical protein [Pseudoduganella namucuonensis]SFU57931.1 hypothetical protein SAMN05216552_1005127 [Pseudoduganella namucuonensis]